MAQVKSVLINWKLGFQRITFDLHQKVTIYLFIHLNLHNLQISGVQRTFWMIVLLGQLLQRYHQQDLMCMKSFYTLGILYDYRNLLEHIMTRRTKTEIPIPEVLQYPATKDP